MYDVRMIWSLVFGEGAGFDAAFVGMHIFWTLSALRFGLRVRYIGGAIGVFFFLALSSERGMASRDPAMV